MIKKLGLLTAMVVLCGYVLGCGSKDVTQPLPNKEPTFEQIVEKNSSPEWEEERRRCFTAVREASYDYSDVAKDFNRKRPDKTLMQKIKSGKAKEGAVCPITKKPFVVNTYFIPLFEPDSKKPRTSHITFDNELFAYIIYCENHMIFDSY